MMSNQNFGSDDGMDSVSFTDFSKQEKSKDSYENSNFNLIRQVSATADKTIDPRDNKGQASTVMELIKSKPAMSASAKVDTTNPLSKLRSISGTKDTSSLQNFLRGNEIRNTSSDFTNPHSQVSNLNTKSSGYKGDINQNLQKSSYSELIKSATPGVYSCNSGNDSLQEIYKRLLKCQ